MIGLTTLKKFLSIPLVALTTLSATLAVVSGCGTAKTIQESVVVKDTVIVTKERKLVDTLMLYKDTVIYQDRVKVKVEYRDNYVKIEADCPTDTVTVTTVKVVAETREKPKRNTSPYFYLGWLVVIFCLMIILKQVLKSVLD